MASKPVFIIVGAAVLLAGCSSSYADRKKANAHLENICPEAPVQRALAARAQIDRLKPGISTVKELKPLGKPTKELHLWRPDEPLMHVVFYPLGYSSCPWVSNSPNFIPVIIQNRKILGYGIETLRTLQDQGWALGWYRAGVFRAEFETIPWAWQSYNYSYLPRR